MSQPPQPPHDGQPRPSGHGPGSQPDGFQGPGPQYGGPQGPGPQHGGFQGTGPQHGGFQQDQAPQYGGPQGPGSQQSPHDAGHGQPFAFGGDQSEKKQGWLTPRNIISILVGIALLGFFGWRLIGDQQRAQALQVGNCVTAKGDPENVDVKAADCDDDGSDGVILQVISAHEGAASCAEPMVEYTEVQSRRGNERVNRTVCLGEVLHTDTCYQVLEQVPFFRSVDCADSDFKVTKVLEDDSGLCEPEEFPMVYEEWPRTYCTADN